jgi:hypothetical protein
LDQLKGLIRIEAISKERFWLEIEVAEGGRNYKRKRNRVGVGKQNSTTDYIK